MKVLVLVEKPRKAVVNRVTSSIKELGEEYTVAEMIPRDVDADLIVIIGGDGDVLKAFHQLPTSKIPVLGVDDSDEGGFLTDVGVGNFRSAFERILEGDYVVEENSRLSVNVDGIELPPALNETGLFSARSATMLEYVLSVDDELVWRDYSDGVLVSTPTGSTAYSMSAGGPMVLSKSEAFVIISVNSLDVTRRPLVVPDKSHINISEINCRVGCEMVCDGTFRAKVKENVEITKAVNDARLVRLSNTSKAMGKIARKVRLAEELVKMPPSAKLILKTLQYEGPLTQRDLVRKTVLPDRTTRSALSLLIERGLVKRRTSLRDARQSVYYAT